MKLFYKISKSLIASIFMIWIFALNFCFAQNISKPDKAITSEIINSYFASKKYDIARKYADEFKIQSEKNKNIKDLKEAYHLLFMLDSVQGNYKSSLENYKHEIACQDSLYNSEKSRQVSELLLKYDTEKKDRDLLLKEKNNQLLLKQSELQKNKLSETNLIRNISFGALVLLLIFILLIFRRYHINKKVRKEIDSKNNALEHLVAEKEFLLKEIHHRVKNNLQIIMSLLNTQSHFLVDSAAKSAISNSQHRIHSMSLLHKKLYQSENVVAVSMDIYIQELIEYFKQSFDIGNKIRFIFDIQPIELDSARAVPVGLILNEAIVNAIKHAFPENRKGTISVSLHLTAENRILLKIIDDGIGVSKDFESNNASLGMKLIKGFSGELNGKLKFETDSGLEISLEFDYVANLASASSHEINELSA